MIARPTQCDQPRLARVLSDQGSDADQQWAAHHLDHCARCCECLEKLTADAHWWNETRTILRTATLVDDPPSSFQRSCGTTLGNPHESSPESNGQESSSRSTHWVHALLEKQPTVSEGNEPASDPTPCLGMIDAMPVTSVIGQGGMGVVLRAEDRQLHRALAIKLLSPMLASSGAARQRFLREAQAAASVVHPNIVPIFAVSTEREIPYLVMPFVSGGNLQQVIDREGPLPIERVLNIGIQVAEGLAAAHAQGIVHRDIKPANLMLDEGGFRILITDFGLARAADDVAITASGMVAGTPQFMSPEQARGDSVDHRSDLYSLGAVLYTLSTGRPPIAGSSTLDVLHRIAHQAPRRVIEVNEQLPLWFQRLVEWLMAPQIDQRMESAEQAATMLRGALSHARTPHRWPLPIELRETMNLRRLAGRLNRRTAKWIAAAMFIVLPCLAVVPWLNSTGVGPQAAQGTTQADSVPRSDSQQPSASAVMQTDAGNRSQTANVPVERSLPPGDLTWESVEVESILNRTRIQLNHLQQSLGIESVEHDSKR